MKKLVEKTTISYADSLHTPQSVSLTHEQDMHSDGLNVVRDIITIKDPGHRCHWVTSGQDVGELEVAIHPERKFMEIKVREAHHDLLSGKFISEKQGWITLDGPVAKELYQKLKAVFEVEYEHKVEL